MFMTEMRQLVHNFVESLQDEDENLSFSNVEQLKEVSSIIIEKMESLLVVIQQGDKKKWYKEICIDNPNKQ